MHIRGPSHLAQKPAPARHPAIPMALQIFVKTLRSERFAIEVRATCTIREVKHMIALPLGVPLASQRLVFEGTELHDAAMLCDHNIRAGAVLLVLVRHHLISIHPLLHNLLCAVNDLRHAVLAYEQDEEQLDIAVQAHRQAQGGGHGDAEVRP